ncbi:putative transmembrane protein [Enhygromyxa salina]|uniref:Putative transmembrane protein n=1 Tax=Enhygromyxa salina TaxID=215803 RepID=A0A0C2CRZ2_9BACT|nr:CAP domain-containing protein [Enhygromyxa salina]KIG12420.1 putative transmembrane protein [Enhygromyxa salina]
MAHSRSWLLALGLCLGICACTGNQEDEPPEVPADVEYCDAVSDWDPALSQLEAEVLVLVNEQRAAGAMCGNDSFEPAQPLTMDPALRCAARRHAVDMGEQDYFSNLDPEGLTFADRAGMAEYEGTARGQTIGARQSVADQVVTAIMGSTGLCAQVMDPLANEIGIGHAPDTDAKYVRYWAQVFGER